MGSQPLRVELTERPPTALGPRSSACNANRPVNGRGQGRSRRRRGRASASLEAGRSPGYFQHSCSDGGNEPHPVGLCDRHAIRGKTFDDPRFLHPRACRLRVRGASQAECANAEELKCLTRFERGEAPFSVRRIAMLEGERIEALQDRRGSLTTPVLVARRSTNRRNRWLRLPATGNVVWGIALRHHEEQRTFPPKTFSITR